MQPQRALHPIGSSASVQLARPPHLAVVLDRDPPRHGVDVLATRQVRAAITRYVVLPNSHALVAVVLWIASTHAASSLYHFPRLAIRSPEKRCG